MCVNHRNRSAGVQEAIASLNEIWVLSTSFTVDEHAARQLTIYTTEFVGRQNDKSTALERARRALYFRSTTSHHRILPNFWYNE